MTVSAGRNELDRLEARWRAGIPSVGLVAVEDGTSLDLVREILATSGLEISNCAESTDSIASSYFVALLASSDPVEALAFRAAAAIGEDPHQFLARLRENFDALEPRSLAGLGSDPCLHIAVAAVLGPWRTVGDLWQRALQLASRSQLGAEHCVAGFAVLFDAERLPVLLLAPDDGSCMAAIATAGRLAEVRGTIRIVIAVAPAALERIEADGSRWAALAREGRFKVADSGGMHAAPPVSAERTELEELRNVPPPVPPAVVQRVRSLAERVMFEALERRRATRGRFELNGTIDALFGPREAEIDLIDRNLRIAVEIDGFHHFTDSDAYRRDRRKDVLLQNEGFLVIRILADDVLEAVEEAVDRVVAASALRRTRTGSP